jgi:uncharacterized membrane protein
MNNQLRDLASALLRKSFDTLSERERQVIRRIAEGAHISRNTNKEFEAGLTFGERVADRVAAFGGSWTFIMIFGACLVIWVVINSFILLTRPAFDPYPYILLNLFLSMLAALQAPVIMMSQNRQAAKDRIDAAHDYEVNLKAELEILGLHQKLDAMREQQWAELLGLQREQMRFLTQLLDQRAQEGGN